MKRPSSSRRGEEEGGRKGKMEDEEEEGGKEEKKGGYKKDGRKGEADRAKDGTSLLTFLLVEVIVPRDYLHGSSSHCQTANLVVLHSTVHGHNVGRTRGIVETRGLGGRGRGRKIQSSMQANIQSSMQANIQSSMQANIQSSMQANIQSSMQK